MKYQPKAKRLGILKLSIGFGGALLLFVTSSVQINMLRSQIPPLVKCDIYAYNRFLIYESYGSECPEYNLIDSDIYTYIEAEFLEDTEGVLYRTLVRVEYDFTEESSIGIKSVLSYVEVNEKNSTESEYYVFSQVNEDYEVISNYYHLGLLESKLSFSSLALNEPFDTVTLSFKRLDNDILDATISLSSSRYNSDELIGIASEVITFRKMYIFTTIDDITNEEQIVTYDKNKVTVEVFRQGEKLNDGSYTYSSSLKYYEEFDYNNLEFLGSYRSNEVVEYKNMGYYEGDMYYYQAKLETSRLTSELSKSTTPLTLVQLYVKNSDGNEVDVTNNLEKEMFREFDYIYNTFEWGYRSRYVYNLYNPFLNYMKGWNNE